MDTIDNIMKLADEFRYARTYEWDVSDAVEAGQALRTAVTELASTATEYQQAADKMAMDHKVVRDRWIPMFDALQAESHTLRQQLAEAQALIEASRKQEPVAWRTENANPPGGFVIFQQSPQALLENGSHFEPICVAPDVQHANLLEVMKDIVQLWDHCCYEHGDGIPSRLHIRAKAAIAAMGDTNE